MNNLRHNCPRCHINRTPFFHFPNLFYDKCNGKKERYRYRILSVFHKREYRCIKYLALSILLISEVIESRIKKLMCKNYTLIENLYTFGQILKQ